MFALIQGTVHADDIPPEVLVRHQDKEAMENLYAQLFTPKPTPEEIPAINGRAIPNHTGE